jgi:hypothetical protein
MPVTNRGLAQVHNTVYFGRLYAPFIIDILEIYTPGTYSQTLAPMPFHAPRTMTTKPTKIRFRRQEKN